jgi:mRNA interferase RelE/StbE
MKVLYTKKFNKDIDQITHDKKLKKNLLELIAIIKQADALTDLESVRKIQGYDKYFRIRVDDFRLGIKITNDGIEMLRFLHRKDIYRRFP